MQRNMIQYQNNYLIDPRTGIPGCLSFKEVIRLNEAYARFCSAERILAESNIVIKPQRRIQAFERFLLEEDAGDLSSERSLTELWDSIKGAAKKVGGAISSAAGAAKDVVKKVGSAAADTRAGKLAAKVGGEIAGGAAAAARATSRAVAGKRRLTKGGSIGGLGKKSKMQKGEYERLQSDEGVEGETIRAIKAKLGADYPNQKNAEEFKKQTVDAAAAVDELAKEYSEDAPLIYKTWNKWLSYMLDQEMGDHYLHFMESKQMLRHRILTEAGFMDKLKSLGKSAVEKVKSKGEELKKKYVGDDEDLSDSEAGLAVKKGGAESIKAMKSEVLPNILTALGKALVSAGAGTLVGVFRGTQGVKVIQTLAAPENHETVVEAIDEGDPAPIEDILEKTALPPVTVESRYVGDAIKELGTATGTDLKSPEDFKKFMDDYPGGPEKLFRDLGVDNAKANAGKVMADLDSGKSVETAFGIGRKTAKAAGAGLDWIPPRLDQLNKDLLKDLGVSQEEFEEFAKKAKGKSGKQLKDLLGKFAKEQGIPDDKLEELQSAIPRLNVLNKEMLKNLGLPEEDIFKITKGEAGKKLEDLIATGKVTPKQVEEFSKEVGIPKDTMMKLARGLTGATGGEAAGAGGPGFEIGGMERLGGSKPISIAGLVAVKIVKGAAGAAVKSAVKKAVKAGVGTAITSVTGGVGLGAAAAATAAAGAVGAGAGAIIAAKAVQALRTKSQDPKYSRSAFLNDLYRDVSGAEEELTTKKADIASKEQQVKDIRKKLSGRRMTLNLSNSIDTLGFTMEDLVKNPPSEEEINKRSEDQNWKIMNLPVEEFSKKLKEIVKAEAEVKKFLGYDTSSKEMKNRIKELESIQKLKKFKKKSKLWVLLCKIIC